MAVRDQQDETADREPQDPAARERRQLGHEQEPEQERERHAQPVTPLEPEVDRREDQDREDELDPEVVRVAGERVRPVDARAVHGTVDVDLARPARERLEHDGVEVVAGLRREQLQDPVAGVDRDPAQKPRQRAPVEPPRAAREVDHARHEEREVDQPLDDSLAVLVEGLTRLEVEEADQVDEQEGGQEGEQHRGRPRHRPVATAQPVEGVREQEAEGGQVGKEDRPGDVPLHLGEGGAEDGRQEEERDDWAFPPHFRPASRAARPAPRRAPPARAAAAARRSGGRPAASPPASGRAGRGAPPGSP